MFFLGKKYNPKLLLWKKRSKVKNFNIRDHHFETVKEKNNMESVTYQDY